MRDITLYITQYITSDEYLFHSTIIATDSYGFN
jgi:hypothetical protein